MPHAPGLATQTRGVEATRSSWRWSPEELAELASSDIGLGRVEDADMLTLVVSAADWVYERVVPNATPLRSRERRGAAEEVAVQDAAATWGLPGLVMGWMHDETVSDEHRHMLLPGGTALGEDQVARLQGVR
ncbi:hypothetical protein GCM10023237_01550 [Streptomyces coeruleoprunus]